MAIEFKLPELGENIEFGKVIAVLVSVGDTIAVDASVIEVETDKALIEVPSSVGGKVTEIHLRPGEEVKVGQTILLIEEAGEKAGASAEAAPPGAGAPAAPAEGEEAPPAWTAPGAPSPKKEAAPAAPLAHRIAREAGVDIRDVPGSGAGGRISLQDVREFVAAQGGGAVSEAPAPAQLHAPVALPDLARWGEVRRTPMSGVRRATSAHLARAWTSIPHVTQCEKADITQLEALRKKFAPKAADAGGKLTITAILMKVVASALKVFPQFNASVDAAVGEIVYKSYVSVGVAVDTENGLLVPVIRDADKKNIIELSAELRAAAERARARKLGPDDMQGGSITITNLGGFGGTYFTPIVNWPEVAILGVSRARIEPVWREEKFQPRLMLPLMVSYDHRAIDGAEGIRFLRWVAQALEEPILMSLEG